MGASWEPTLYDLNGDETPEIIFAVLTGLDARYIDGTFVPGFPVTSLGYTSGAVAVGSFTGDASPDILLKVLDPDTYLYCFHADGSIADGWPVHIGGESYFGGPSFADLDSDADLEALATSWSSGVTSLWALHGDGSTVDGFPVSVPGHSCYSSPVVGDVDHDGDLEIFFTAKSLTGSLYGIDHLGNMLPGFPRFIQFNIECSPILANFDTDPSLEVLIADSVDPGQMIAYNPDGTVVAGFPFYQEVGPGPGSAAVGDVDRDGDMEIAMTNLFGTVFLWDLAVPWDPQTVGWSTFLHDNWNTSQYGFTPPDETSRLSATENRVDLRWGRAYPNPFRTSTRVVFNGPTASPVRVRVFDSQGRLARDLSQMSLRPGEAIVWDGRDASGRPLPSGRYLIQRGSTTAEPVLLVR